MARKLGRHHACALWLLTLAPVMAACADPGSPVRAPLESSSRAELPASQASGAFRPGSLSQVEIRAIATYVDRVERRLGEGRYRRLDADDQDWIQAQIGALQRALAEAATSPQAALALRRLAVDFNSRMAWLDQGGVVCRQERRTGSSMMSRRCFTRKLLAQQTVAEQERWRRMSRLGTGTHKPRSLR